MAPGESGTWPQFVGGSGFTGALPRERTPPRSVERYPAHEPEYAPHNTTGVRRMGCLGCQNGELWICGKNGRRVLSGTAHGERAMSNSSYTAGAAVVVQFLTLEQCRLHATGTGHRLDNAQDPIPPSEDPDFVRCGVPPDHSRLTWFCRHLEHSLQPRSDCLLWVTEYGVWPNSENGHLYYRLRESYGDRRLFHEAPGHLFLATCRCSARDMLNSAVQHDGDPDRGTLRII